MKKFLVLVLIGFIFSCTGVDSGHKGTEIIWGGKTNLTTVYPEGMHYGIHWLWDDMIEYDVREKTYKEKYEFNDKNNMKTGVEVSCDYNLEGSKVNIFHSKIGRENFDIKLQKTIQSAAKEVIPQYTASELNLTKRAEAEEQLSKILAKELPSFYANFIRVQLTDVDIPEAIALAAEQTAKQAELNKLSDSKIQDSKNKFLAAEFDSKTKAILSQPAMLELQKIENEKIMWQGYAKHGNSPYGSNNIFGSTNPSLLLQRK